ncbi:MAG: glycosyltransferase family 2 protein [bacterium]|nr:glycosyltransferase family 2 protein [bacterium]
MSVLNAAQINQKTDLQKKVLLILPCFNEQENIGGLLSEIQALNRSDYTTLVIDDGSSDRTFEIALSQSICLQHPCNLGIGGAVQSGIKYAYAKGFDFCVQVDGDAQHPPQQIEILLKEYEREPSNLIIGSRFLRRDSFISTFTRRIGIHLISTTIKFLFRKEITDPTSGLRLMDRKAMALFSKNYPADFPEPLSNALAIERGLTLREVPVAMRVREAGVSSLAGIKSIKYMVRVIGYLFLLRVSRHL